MTHSADEQISYRLWPSHLSGKRGDDGRQRHLFLLPPKSQRFMIMSRVRNGLSVCPA